MEALLDQRLSQRTQALLARGREQFRAGDYQAAIAHLKIARSMMRTSDPELGQLMALVSLAAGSYAQGGYELVRMLRQGQDVLPDNDEFVQELYAHWRTLERDVRRLRGRVTGNLGSQQEHVLYVFALWCQGERGNARAEAAQMSKSDGEVAAWGKALVEAMDRKSTEPEDSVAAAGP
jgi:lipopolysaccharide biosynthesis regulator YciM